MVITVSSLNVIWDIYEIKYINVDVFLLRNNIFKWQKEKYMI